MENCNRDYDWDQMILVVGDYASYFWLEPNNYEKGSMKVGIGLWAPLEESLDIYKTQLRYRMFLCLNKYKSLFKHAFIVNEHYSKISADPVNEIVFNTTVFFGEAAGMTNPYWLLGSKLYLDYAKKFAPIIVDATKDINQLGKIQAIWYDDLSNYSKLWAGARVMWMEDSIGWREILRNREKLDKYTTQDQIINRQSGANYSIFYLYRMWGIKRLFKALYQIIMFKLRRKYSWFRSRYHLKQRQNFTSLEDPKIMEVIREIEILLETNYQLNLQIQN